MYTPPGLRLRFYESPFNWLPSAHHSAGYNPVRTTLPDLRRLARRDDSGPPGLQHGLPFLAI
eukprot:5001469-Pyramimonas_sp.AAC.1